MNLKENFVLGIYGDCRGGKSHLIRYIIHCQASKKLMNHCLVFSNTALFTNDYDYIPDKYVYDRYDENILQAYMNVQRNAKEEGTASRGVVIFDDVLGDATFNSKVFTNFITTYRHYNLDVIISSQYISKIPLFIRNICSHACLFRLFSKPALETSFESYGMAHDSLKAWTRFMKRNTAAKYTFVFVDKNLDVNDPLDRFKALTAPARIPEFKLSY